MKTTFIPNVIIDVYSFVDIILQYEFKSLKGDKEIS